MELPALSKIKFFIGVDISKNKLDFAVKSKEAVLLHRVIPNTKAAVTAFLSELKESMKLSRGNSVFCMENTGIYGHLLLAVLVKLRAFTVVENGYHVLHSMGISREKNDKVDAIRLTIFAERHYSHLRVWQPCRPVIAKLAHLSTLRDRLVNIATKLKTPLKEDKQFIVESLSAAALAHCKKSLDAIQADVKKIESAIDKLIAADGQLTALKNIVTSVPGVGKHTALQVIIRSNEFISINDPKKFACYAGVVPFKMESGLKTSKAKISRIANRKLKSLLHICAVRAIRVDPELRAYYERKIAEGKPKMSVVNAVRNKLVLRIFACVNQRRLFCSA